MTTLKITLENKHKYIDEYGNLTVPPEIKKVTCRHLQLTSLVVPEGIKILSCSYNKLTHLIVPGGIQILDCSDNNLTSLIVPEGVKKLWCSNNNIAHLDVPEGIQILYCYNNKLIYINFKSPESLKYLGIEGNENLVYPPKEYCSKSMREIVEWCNIHEIPQKLRLPERYKERWNIIKLMYIAHYKESLDPEDSDTDNFNTIPIEVITGVITRYVLT